MRAWFWACVCDWSARIYLVAARRLWIAATGTPVPTVIRSIAVVRQTGDTSSDIESPEETVKAITAKWRN